MKEPLDRELANINPEDFSFYRDFLNLEEARALTVLLDENNIPYRLETSDTIIDTAIVGNGLIPQFVLKILSEDFIRINKLIEAQYKNLSFEDVKDHYLNELENDELEEIFEKQDEWTIENVNVARIILSHRGIKIEEKEIKKQRAERLAGIRKGKKGSIFWMTVYIMTLIFGIFISLIFVVAGIGMSYYYAYGKSTDADGNRHFIYEPKTRFIGTIMLYGGLLIVLLEILFMMFVF